MKKVFYSVAIILFISSLTAAVIAYGRGYRLNPGDKSINSTGVLSANSTPDAASILIDGKLTSATNNAISLAPNWYNLQIAKTRYQSWEKRIRIQGEVVTRVDALLIPTNPSLRALTVSGVSAPVLSPTGTRVAYIVSEEEATVSASLKSKTGVWIFELRNGPLGGIADPRQVYTPQFKTDWTHTQLLWSPDEKELILLVKTKNNKTEKIISATQIFLDNPNPTALPATNIIDNILSEWKDLESQKQDQLLSSFSLPLSDFLKNTTDNIKISPDNNKILYLATASATLGAVVTPPLIGTNTTEEIRKMEPGKYYVYDIKEDKNFQIADQKSLASVPQWYSDSKRIVMIENISINIIDYDGTNKRTVYTGPFANNIVYPWTSAGRLVILTNLNKPQSLPNLYEVDIR